MSTIDEQLNNPLHGLKLETLLTELIEHYGFEILAEYTNINCFKNRATIASSLKFLKKTEWAREKMERFYLYNYKNLPKADDTQYEITPRQRIIPAHQTPREPKVLLPGEAPAPKERGSFRPNNDKFNAKRERSPAHSRSTNRSDSRTSYRSSNKANGDTNNSNASSDPYANAPK